ncbi:helix-turn-helix domain-containing protein [Chromobacterium subtsugae]|uniref:helix-turn-helix domain-containing protein n=1 Tax=Chromobacterium subtsugae TaxID=251747 RepID=UPI000640D528|nr:helix-turn-helix transcriptional regulator [Chromobacterium subtsugae]
MQNEDALAKSVGKAIAKRRISIGLRQEEVAEKLGIGLEAMSRMERGVVIPTITRMMQLSEIFGCSTADLVQEASYRPTDQAMYITDLLAKLADEDRTMLVGMIEQLAARLQKS